MEYAVVNPSWYVPPSILKTMLPKLAGYGGKSWGGYEVVRRGGHISLRQPPGERNALGFIKFMFPNQHAVYLHDTPNRSLFSAREARLQPWLRARGRPVPPRRRGAARTGPRSG